MEMTPLFSCDRATSPQAKLVNPFTPLGPGLGVGLPVSSSEFICLVTRLWPTQFKHYSD